MKTNQPKNSILTSLKSSTKNTFQLVFLSSLIAFSSFKSYGNEKAKTVQNGTEAEQISLKAHYENESDVLNWSIQNATPIAYFTVQRAESEEMNFNEVVSINPVECSTANKLNSYDFKIPRSEENAITYYKVKAVYLDNRTTESDVVSIKKSNPVSNFNIIGISNSNGQITVIFNSLKSQNVTINILNKMGQLIMAKNIFAIEGINTYNYNSDLANTNEMLIFSLSNFEEQITKKYMFAQNY